MLNFLDKADAELEKDVENELKYDPSITDTDIGVTAKDGIETLRGTVPHYIEKTSAEKAAQRVSGVKAVADELEVSIMDSMGRTDKQIAEAAISTLQWSYSAPKDTKVVVEKGWVTLSGEADWDYQRNAAKEAVSNLNGVVAVFNNIKIKSKVKPADIKNRIEEALKRSAEAESQKIQVAVSGDEVTLSGKVHSLSEREVARFAAFMAPGIMKVQNDLRVSH
jgi:osmotically-inducible protein OsmY